MKRKLILHYHLFKNAGTTVDKLLSDSFGDAWQNWDKPVGSKSRITPAEMALFIELNPQLRAVSSHDAVMPMPVGDFTIYPIFFLRHPIIRARSAWMFEWKKEAGTDQPKGSFAEYVKEYLSGSMAGVIANFQVNKLSNVDYGSASERKALRDFEKLERAKLVVDSVPFFGLVEHMHQSLVRMHYYLKASFPDIRIYNTQTNVTQDINQATDEKLEAIQSELGAPLYAELVARNDLDIKLYTYAVNRFFSVARA